MKVHEFIQLLLYFGLLVGLTPLLGGFMARVFEGQRNPLSRVLGPVEKWIYRLGGVDPAEEMSWKRYFFAVLLFHVHGPFHPVVLEEDEDAPPVEPLKIPNLPWALALNTAISFITNTNWQAY